MLQTATVTDLRFKTKEVLEKCKNLIWIFNHGKRVALLIDAQQADELLKKTAFEPRQTTRKHPSLLETIRKFSFKGPKNLSKSIDETLYG